LEAVVGLVAGLTERDERAEAVRLRTMPMMRAEASLRTASLAGEVVPHLRAQHSFPDVDRLVAVGTAASDTDPVRVEVRWRSDLARRIVPVCGLAGTQVRVRKPRHPFVPVSPSDEFPRCGEPLIHDERMPALVHRGRPSRSSMDHPGLCLDEVLLAAAFVLLEQPEEVAVPGVAADLLDVADEAGVLVVFGPSSNDRVQAAQSGHLIEPCPSSGREGFDRRLDPSLTLRGRPQVGDPPSLGATSSDTKSEEIEPVVDVGDHRLVRRQREVELGGEKRGEFLLGVFDASAGIIADDHEIIRVADHLVVPATGGASLLATVSVDRPLHLGPPIKLVQVDVGEEWGHDATLGYASGGVCEQAAVHHAGFEELPDEGEEVTAGDAALEETEQFAMVDGVEVALEVTFDDVEVFGTAVEQWQEDGDRIHRAPLFAEAVGVRTKVRFVDRVEDGTEGFLDDPVSEGWNPQRARLPVTLGNEDPAYRERFVRLRLQEAH